MTVDDEMLMAYVDGELGPAETARIDAEALADPVLAQRIETHRRLNASIAGVFGEVVAETPPDHLVEAISKARPPAEVVDLQAARRQRATPPAARTAPSPWLRWGLLAASALIAVGVGYRMTTPGGTMVSGPPGAMVAQGRLNTALNVKLASAGIRPGDAVRVGVSFRATDGHYCRTFRVTGSEGFDGLACHGQGGWRVRETVAAAAGPGTDYRQAGSETPPAIAATVETMIDGAPLNAQQEAAARKHGW